MLQVLEQLKADNAQVCLSICQKFVEVFNNQRDILFISSYILNQLSSELDDQLRDQLRLTHIGSRVSLTFSVLHGKLLLLLIFQNFYF